MPYACRYTVQTMQPQLIHLLFHMLVNFAWTMQSVMAVYTSYAPYELVYSTFNTLTEQSGLIELICRDALTAEVLDISDIKIWLNRTLANDPHLWERGDVGVVEANGCCRLRFNLTHQLEGMFTCGKQTDIANVKESLPRTLICKL